MREKAAGPWRPIKVREATYKKIVLMKSTLEQAEQRPITMGETVDAIFLEVCEDLARQTGKALPEDLYLHAKEATRYRSREGSRSRPGLAPPPRGSSPPP